MGQSRRKMSRCKTLNDVVENRLLQLLLRLLVLQRRRWTWTSKNSEACDIIVAVLVMPLCSPLCCGRKISKAPRVNTWNSFKNTKYVRPMGQDAYFNILMCIPVKFA
jgi:hypothetical protein